MQDSTTLLRLEAHNCLHFLLHPFGCGSPKKAFTCCSISESMHLQSLFIRLNIEKLGKRHALLIFMQCTADAYNFYIRYTNLGAARNIQRRILLL